MQGNDNFSSEHYAIVLNDRMIKLRCNVINHGNSLISVSCNLNPKFIIENMCCTDFEKEVELLLSTLA